jgi:hypothetical protein
MTPVGGLKTEVASLRSMLEDGLELAHCAAQLSSLSFSRSATRTDSTMSEQGSVMLRLPSDLIDIEGIMLQELHAAGLQAAREAQALTCTQTGAGSLQSLW